MNEKVFFRGKKALSFFALFMVLIMSFSFAGCTNGGAGGKGDASATNPKTVVEGPAATSADLYCLEFNAFSGIYVENGKNEEVKNVASILVENRSEAFLDRATVKYKYGDDTATFVVTGLPAGQKCWVMEANKLKIDTALSFEFEDCVSAFKNDALLNTDKLLVTAEDNVLTVKNISEDTLENVCVYYKNTMDDGNFLGGITYMITFDTLKPGESAEKESGHYSETSKIVRYSFQ